MQVGDLQPSLALELRPAFNRRLAHRPVQRVDPLPRAVQQRVVIQPGQFARRGAKHGLHRLALDLPRPKGQLGQQFLLARFQVSPGGLEDDF